MYIYFCIIGLSTELATNFFVTGSVLRGMNELLKSANFTRRQNALAKVLNVKMCLLSSHFKEWTGTKYLKLLKITGVVNFGE